MQWAGTSEHILPAKALKAAHRDGNQSDPDTGSKGYYSQSLTQEAGTHDVQVAREKQRQKTARQHPVER